MAGRRIARSKGPLEVLGILAAIVPCGILAGLYLATGDARFIVGCALLAVLAVAIVLLRNAQGLDFGRFFGRFWPRVREGGTDGTRTDDGIMAGLQRTLTRPVMKILGFALWMIAWGFTAALYARVYEGASIGILVVLVVIGGFSPVVIYFGLEGGVRKLGGRIRDGE